MAVALIDYGAGNLRSAAKALEAAGASSVRVTSSPADVLSAERIVLPGVGAFGACAAALRAVPGLEEALDRAVREHARPFLGICVGMQLMADEGHEFGVHRGLGWVPGAVRRMAPEGLKVPQIGWNEVAPGGPGLLEAGYAYFVHSYAFETADAAHLAATASYGAAVTAAVQRDTMLGVQFHPEKSQAYGLALLTRWLNWRP
ncbi:imidazole glycerol phosphate synthase subunit HisH [Sandaracinobacter sp. RS1-74]|uniref:imidazole glycerol phosphate synthase subunit HisH n=1 Tax=Sandaracinobacteroides sayramensis TaxID=2913411 RepID=UPI001EDA9FCF|nr:imidazole glycerol phosphate synthase subunit HisH [Sandaracinobacteroides sayramensis]MCG2842779.1 imidazole glycerol phosphate synthase subunit HisH [Sandaracinobacteroides sayramensis]